MTLKSLKPAFKTALLSAVGVVFLVPVLTAARDYVRTKLNV